MAMTESAEEGEAISSLRLASATGLVITALFIVLFDRAKHDPDLACVNPFALDPYDAVGSFGVQIALAAGVLSALRAFRPAVPGESFAVRQTFILRAIGVSQVAVAVTMIADIAAMALAPSMWYGTPAGQILVMLAGALLVVPLVLCALLIRIARRSGRCSQNPLRSPRIVPFVILMALLVLYPPPWREGIAGALLTAGFGIVVLLVSVALLSQVMFPCPDVPEVDLLDDLGIICRRIISRGERRVGKASRREPYSAVVDRINPRIHPWRLVVLLSMGTGLLLAFAEFAAEGPARGSGRALLVIAVFLVLETGGVCLGYSLLRKFLGLFRSDRHDA